MIKVFFFQQQKVIQPVTILSRKISAETTDLKAVLQEKIPAEQERVKAFRKDYGGTKLGDVTVDMVFNFILFHFVFYMHLFEYISRLNLSMFCTLFFATCIIFRYKQTMK